MAFTSSIHLLSSFFWSGVVEVVVDTYQNVWDVLHSIRKGNACGHAVKVAVRITWSVNYVIQGIT